MMSAKVGTGIVAELGAMRISDEIDALEVMGINSMTFLCATRLLAAWLVLPFMYIGRDRRGLPGLLHRRGPADRLRLLGRLPADLLAVPEPAGLLIQPRSRRCSWPPRSCSSPATTATTPAAGPVGVGRATAKSMVLNIVLVHVIGDARDADLLGRQPARADRRLRRWPKRVRPPDEQQLHEDGLDLRQDEFQRRQDEFEHDVHTSGRAPLRPGRRSPPTAAADAIEFIDVHKSFGRNHVLRGLNMALPEDQISMILGPVGHGQVGVHQAHRRAALPRRGRRDRARQCRSPASPTPSCSRCARSSACCSRTARCSAR